MELLALYGHGRCVVNLALSSAFVACLERDHQIQYIIGAIGNDR